MGPHVGGAGQGEGFGWRHLALALVVLREEPVPVLLDARARGLGRGGSAVLLGGGVIFEIWRVVVVYILLIREGMIHPTLPHTTSPNQLHFLLHLLIQPLHILQLLQLHQFLLFQQIHHIIQPVNLLLKIRIRTVRL